MSRTGKRRALALVALVVGATLLYAVTRIRAVEKDALRQIGRAHV